MSPARKLFETRGKMCFFIWNLVHNLLCTNYAMHWVQKRTHKNACEMHTSMFSPSAHMWMRAHAIFFRSVIRDNTLLGILIYTRCYLLLSFVILADCVCVCDVLFVSFFLSIKLSTNLLFSSTSFLNNLYVCCAAKCGSVRQFNGIAHKWCLVTNLLATDWWRCFNRFAIFLSLSRSLSIACNSKQNNNVIECAASLNEGCNWRDVQFVL